LNLIKNTFVDGSIIESKLLEPPTGYLYGTVVSTVAALMRGGRIIAKFGGSEKYSYRDPDVDSIFKTATNFRKASFKGINRSLSASQKNDIVVVLKEFEAVDRNGKKVDWNTNDYDLVCAISRTAEEHAGKIKAWREANSKFDAYYPDMVSVESVLKQFIGNVNDQNYIDKAIAFISSKDAFSEAIEAVMSCSDFIKNRQAKAEAWKAFVQEVNDDLTKAAKTVQSIALATNDFNWAFGSGLMQKYAELQSLSQKIRDEYFKKYSEAALAMSTKYEAIKLKAEAVIQEIETLGIEENAVLKSKAQNILAFAEGRICKNPKITTSIKEDNTKLTFSEVLSANDIAGQKETALNIIDAQIIRQKPDKPHDETLVEGGNTPNPKEKKDIVNTIKRELPKPDITVSEYKTWLLSEIKTVSAMKDTDMITF